jgi:hypothetical protein
MGREKFDVELTGKLEGETIQAAGFVPGTKLRISGCLTKKSDLPVRA